jgi:hypothetical protein
VHGRSGGVLQRRWLWLRGSPWWQRSLHIWSGDDSLFEAQTSLRRVVSEHRHQTVGLRLAPIKAQAVAIVADDGCTVHVDDRLELEIDSTIPAHVKDPQANAGSQRAQGRDGCNTKAPASHQ